MTLGLIAGGGKLPLHLLHTRNSANKKTFVIAIEGAAEEELNKHNCHWVGVGELAKAANLLKEAGVAEIFFLGGLTHPNFKNITPDEGGVWVLEQWLQGGADAMGDDAVLRLLLKYFETQGLAIADPLQVLADLIGTAGQQGEHGLDEAQMQDAKLAINTARAVGALDIGQASVACRKRIIAVEGAEGTDGLLRRLAQLPQQSRGTSDEPAGVLAKATKPNQDLRIDLPTIGVETITRAAEAHLAGVVYQAGYTLCDDKEAMVAAADKLGIALVGLEV